MEKIIFPFDTESFFKKCVKHKIFLKNDFKKQAILIKILPDFEDKIIYSEEDVNKKIMKYFEDCALIRRELVNFGYMKKDSLKGEYVVIKRDLFKEDIENNILLKRHSEAYKIMD
jgi:hypothetical protein